MKIDWNGLDYMGRLIFNYIIFFLIQLSFANDVQLLSVGNLFQFSLRDWSGGS